MNNSVDNYSCTCLYSFRHISWDVYGIPYVKIYLYKTERPLANLNFVFGEQEKAEHLKHPENVNGYLLKKVYVFPNL